MENITAWIRGVNTDGNRMYGYIADATVSTSDGKTFTMVETSIATRG